MSMVKLDCPSCGAALELDNSRDFAFCHFCGTKIILTNGFGNVNDNKKIENYFELLDVAMQKSDYDDVKRYANKILELDTRQYMAWDKLCENLEKNKQFFFQTYEGFGEYIKYMKKALEAYDKPDKIKYSTSLDGRFKLLVKDFIVFVLDAKVGVPKWNNTIYPNLGYTVGLFNREDKIIHGAFSMFHAEISTTTSFDKVQSLWFQVKINLLNLSLNEFVQLYYNQQAVLHYQEAWSRPRSKIYYNSDEFRTCYTVCNGFKEVMKGLAAYFEQHKADMAAGKYAEIDLLELTNQDVMNIIIEALKLAYGMVVEIATTMCGLRYNHIGTEHSMEVFQRTGDSPSTLVTVNGGIDKEQRAALNSEIQVYQTKLSAFPGGKPPEKKKKWFNILG